MDEHYTREKGRKYKLQMWGMIMGKSLGEMSNRDGSE